MEINEITGEINRVLVEEDNSYKTAIGGRLFYIENPNDPKEVVYPFCVFQFITGTDDADSKDKWIKPHVQFTHYDDHSSSVRIGSCVKALYDRLQDQEALFTDLVSYKMLDVHKVAPPIRANKTLLGNWQTIDTYEFHLQLI